jgi:hypothetical protein
MSDDLKVQLSHITNSDQAMEFLNKLESVQGGVKFTLKGHKEQGEITIGEIMNQLNKIADSKIPSPLVGRAKTLTENAKNSLYYINPFGFSRRDAEAEIKKLESRSLNLADPASKELFKKEVDEAVNYAIKNPDNENRFSKLHQLLLENNFSEDSIKEMLSHLPSEGTFINHIREHLLSTLSKAPEKNETFIMSLVTTLNNRSEKSMTVKDWQTLAKLYTPKSNTPEPVKCYYNAALLGDEASLKLLDNEVAKNPNQQLWRARHSLATAIQQQTRAERTKGLEGLKEQTLALRNFKEVGNKMLSLPFQWQKVEVTGVHKHLKVHQEQIRHHHAEIGKTYSNLYAQYQSKLDKLGENANPKVREAIESLKTGDLNNPAWRASYDEYLQNNPELESFGKEILSQDFTKLQRDTYSAGYKFEAAGKELKELDSIISQLDAKVAQMEEVEKKALG